MRATALLIRAKMLLAKKKLASFPKENIKPASSAPVADSIITPLRETMHNPDFGSPSTSGYSSARSEAVGNFSSSFQDTMDFQDRPPALIRRFACWNAWILNSHKIFQHLRDQVERSITCLKSTISSPQLTRRANWHLTRKKTSSTTNLSTTQMTLNCRALSSPTVREQKRSPIIFFLKNHIWP